MTPNLSSLTINDSYRGHDQIQVANGQGLRISNTGSSKILSKDKVFHLNNVLHVPSLTKPLLSVQKFTTDNSCFFEFHLTHFFVKDQVTQKNAPSRSE